MNKTKIVDKLGTEAELLAKLIKKQKLGISHEQGFPSFFYLTTVKDGIITEVTLF